MGWPEAIEEALSDRAAALDTDVLLRVWRRVERALAKLGFRSDDELARYMLWQARRYVRTGRSSPGLTLMSHTFDVVKDVATWSTRTAPVVRHMAAAEQLTPEALFEVGRLNDPVEIKAAWQEEVRRTPLSTLGRSAKEAVGALGRAARLLSSTQDEAMKNAQYARVNALVSSQADFATQQNRATEDKLARALNEEGTSAARVYGEFVRALAQHKSQELADNASKPGYGADMYKVVVKDGAPRFATDEDQRALGPALRENTDKGRVSLEQARKGFSYKGSDGVARKYVLPATADGDRAWQIYDGFFTKETASQPGQAGMLREMNQASAQEHRALVDEANRHLGELQAQFKLDNDEFTLVFRAAQSINATRYGDVNERPKSVQTNEARSRAAETKLSTFAKKLHEGPLSGKASLARTASLLREVAHFDTEARLASDRYRQTVLSGYVPFLREGKLQINTVLVGEDGKELKGKDFADLPAEVRRSLPYFKEEKAGDASRLAARVQESFDAIGAVDIGGRKVHLQARISRAGLRRKSQDTRADYHNLMSMLDRVQRQGAAVPDAVRTSLLRTYEDANSRKLNRLPRAGTPGEDKDSLHSAAQHIYNTHFKIAHLKFNSQIQALLDDDAAWAGDPELPNRIAADYAKARAEGNQAAMHLFRKQFERAVYQLSYSLPSKTGGAVYEYRLDGEDKPWRVAGRGEGELARDKAVKLVEWVQQPGSMDATSDDVLDRGIGGAAEAGDADDTARRLAGHRHNQHHHPAHQHAALHRHAQREDGLGHGARVRARRARR